MSHRIVDLTLAVLASVLAFLLSWPYWRAFEYGPESHLAWRLYFAIGFVLAIYVFYVFIRSLHALFSHEMHAHSADGEERP